MMATTSDMVASELAELLIVYLIRAKLSVGRKRKEKKANTANIYTRGADQRL
jgi:hypothetical protein